MRSLGGAVAVAVERHCYRLEIFVSREAVMLIVVVVVVVCIFSLTGYGFRGRKTRMAVPLSAWSLVLRTNVDNAIV